MLFFFLSSPLRNPLTVERMKSHNQDPRESIHGKGGVSLEDHVVTRFNFFFRRLFGCRWKSIHTIASPRRHRQIFIQYFNVFYYFPCNHFRTTLLTSGETPLPLPSSSFAGNPLVCFFAWILERTAGEEYAASIRSVASSSRRGMWTFEGVGVFEGEEGSVGFWSNRRTHWGDKGNERLSD